MYALKQFVGVLATPLTVALLVLGLAALFRVFARKRVGLGLSIAAVVLAYLGAIGPVGNALLGPLERRYPAQGVDAFSDVKHVVVLGSGYVPHAAIPVTAALDADGLARIVEGVRLMRVIGAEYLIVSGGAPPGRVPPAHGYARLARELGVPEDSLVVLDSPLDTQGEAREVASRLGGKSFALVTSAYHMPRAMALTRRAGARPIAAPTGHGVIPSGRFELRAWLPSSAGLRKTERALHEYLGLLATCANMNRS